MTISTIKCSHGVENEIIFGVPNERITQLWVEEIRISVMAFK